MNEIIDEEKVENKNNSSKEKTILDKLFIFIKDAPPLFLPVGSVRALLAIGLIGISGLLMLKSITIPEWLYSSLTMILGFYFGARNKS